MNANRILSAPLVWLVRVYQRVISPMSSPSCRFYPSCSSYAVTSLHRFGPVRGGWWAMRRIGRCHPWNPGGVDPVPQTWEGRHDVRPEDFRAPASPTSPSQTDPHTDPYAGTIIGHDGGSTVNGAQTMHQLTEELR